MGATPSRLNRLPQRLIDAGISVHHEFTPGDLGRLIEIHGLQNARDYGFNAVHEAYCARIAADFLIDGGGPRGRFWLAKQAGRAVGSVLIVEQPGNYAQLRILFADDSVRGLGLGRWLVEDAVSYCREVGFESIFLWTVEGLARATAVYRSLGFGVTETKVNEDWRERAVEVRYDLRLA